MKYGILSFWRNCRLGGIAAGVILISVLFLTIFSSGIASYRKELQQSYGALHVTAYIAGEEDQIPQLTQDAYCKIIDSGFISQHQEMAEHNIAAGVVLRALGDIVIDPSLRDAKESIRWASGYDASIFSGNEMVCLLPARLAWEPGGTWEIPIGGTTYTFTVAGVFGSKFSSGAGGSVYYCPLHTLQEIYRQKNLMFSYSAMEMDLQHLDRLSDFKSQMKQLGLQSGNTRLVIRDAQLQTITGQIRRQIRMLETLLPILFALVTGVSFALSFLLLRGRRREAAVLRSLGMKRAQVFKAFLTETSMQALLGFLPGAGLGYILFGPGALQTTHLAILFLCYLLGGGVAIWRLSGINVFTVMTARE